MKPEASSPPELRDSATRELLEAGRHWDSIRVPRRTGLQTLAFLGMRSGAVLEDPQGAALYWFVPTGSARTWDVPHTRALGVTQYVVIPPLHRVHGPGPHWRVPPMDRCWLTDTHLLQNRIERAVNHLCTTHGEAP